MPQPTPGSSAREVMASYWQIRTHRNPFPATSFVSYELQLKDNTTTTLHVPWVARVLKTYSGSQAFLQDYWVAGVRQARHDHSFPHSVEERMTPLENLVVVEQERAQRTRDGPRYTTLGRLSSKEVRESGRAVALADLR
jgi:hypothetical protein